MKDTLFNSLSGLAAIGLVVAALLAGGTGDAGESPATAAATVQAAGHSGAVAANPASAPQRKSRRMGASLSMPYFSFAQSLRPGG